jgi:Putative multicopper oxidases
MSQITIAPGERAEILINFTGVTGPVTMRNTARFPFPKGAAPNPGTDGTIMQFNVGATVVPSTAVPATLNTIPPLTATVTRTRVLWEVMGALGPLEILVNGQKWAGQLSENPAPGATEDWIVVNPTADTHPIHLHLAPFQVVSRQNFDVKKYSADWVAKQYTDCAMAKSVVPLTPCGSLAPPAMGMMRGPPWPNNYTPLELNVTPYLKGRVMPPAANERGWKDTVQMNPGEVTTIRVRFSPIDGSPSYPFMVTDGPGYVWHCHIIDHEDNEMMRRFVVGGTAPPAG